MGVVDSSKSLVDRDILRSLHKPLKFYNYKSKVSRLSKMDAGLFAEAMSVISAPPIVGLSRLFSSDVLPEVTSKVMLKVVSCFDGSSSSLVNQSTDVGGMNPHIQCHSTSV